MPSVLRGIHHPVQLVQSKEHYVIRSAHPSCDVSSEDGGAKLGCDRRVSGLAREVTRPFLRMPLGAIRDWAWGNP